MEDVPRTRRRLSRRVALGLVVPAVVVAAAAVSAIVVSGRGAQSLRADWTAPCGLERTPPATYDHVVWIWFENQDYAHAVSGPAVGHLAASCGLAKRYYGITHPSLPNYIAAVSGGTQGITKNCECTVPAASLMQQTASWRVYAEAMPRPCDTANAEPYEAHHNMAVHFRDIGCARNDVPLTRLAGDLAADRLPRFSFILPDACHSMHFTERSSICHMPLEQGAQVAAGNRWLRRLLPSLLASAAYRRGTTAIFITWDEGFPVSQHGEDCPATRSSDCHTAMVVIAPAVRPHTTSTRFFTHYSLLRTTEELLGIRAHLAAAAGAPSMRAAFNL